jgi:hypothetical protein
MSAKTIAIFGTGQVRPGDQVYETAYKVGKALAQAGYAIINGGYNGTMIAAAKGAREAGGEVVGVTCMAFKSSKANEYTTRQITACTLDERLDKLVELAAGYVVLPGGTGTLLELAMVWELKNKGFLDGGKPIILVGDFWKPVVERAASEDSGCVERCIDFAAEADEVVRKLAGKV